MATSGEHGPTRMAEEDRRRGQLIPQLLIKLSPTLLIKSLFGSIWGQDLEQLIYWGVLSGEGKEAAQGRVGAKSASAWPQGTLWSKNCTGCPTLGKRGPAFYTLFQMVIGYGLPPGEEWGA